MSARARKGAEPAVRPELSREFVAEHKRKRIMAATAELTAERGYEATKISDIVKRAGVARKTLYENFSGKEEVFLATFDTAVAEAMRRIEESCQGFGDGDWQARAEAGLGAFLDYVAEEPALARMCLVEALTAGPSAAERYEAAVGEFVALAQRYIPRADKLPDTIDETLIGGIAWIVYQHVRRGEAEEVAKLLPELAEFLLAPYALSAGAES
jgi:AcrR family transcriptional regulator